MTEDLGHTSKCECRVELSLISVKSMCYRCTPTPNDCLISMGLVRDVFSY